MGTKLYVGNLSYGCTDDDLGNLFSQVGNVSSVRIIVDRETGRSKGFAFVEMETEEAAQEAIQKMAGLNFQGRPLTVNEARPREGGGAPERGMGGGGGRPSRGGPRGGGGGGGGGRGGW